MNNNHVDLLALLTIPGVGSARLRALISHFKVPSKVFESSLKELNSIQSIDTITAQNIVNASIDKHEIEKRLEQLNRLDGKLITFWDEDYPELLKHIYDPPMILYSLGTLKTEDYNAIAIVGTRNPSFYSQKVTETFAAELSKIGLTIVSGLARGIDSTAHRAALSVKGRTIAVIGSGIDIVYPPENINLFKKIIENGSIISEYELGTKPDAMNFPRRNRIISGMSHGSIIIESSENGGAMITASYALDQNREVFSVPGQITERRSSGTNKLIKQGRAKLVQTIDDILDEISSHLRNIRLGRDSKPTVDDQISLNIFEQKVLETLSNQPLHIDQIANLTEFSTSDALVHLLSLEFKGLVRQLPGKMFTRM